MSEARVALFMDLLGVRSRWHSGGRSSAEAAFEHFEAIISASIRPIARDDILTGQIEADSALFVCRSLSPALKITQQAYRTTFLAQTKRDEDRLWIRGAIVPYAGNLDLRVSSPLRGSHGAVSVTRYAPSVLDVIAIEKAGFKGMRMLVRSDVGTGHSSRKRALQVLIKGKHYAPFLKLRTPPYPGRLSLERFRDFAWMASDDSDEMADLRRAMADRLRWAAGDAEEFLQAAATQVLFNHWDALVDSVEPK